MNMQFLSAGWTEAMNSYAILVKLADGTEFLIPTDEATCEALSKIDGGK